MTRTRRNEAELRRLAEASVWRMQLSELDVDSSTEFESWLAQSPDNREAWRRVMAPWAALGEAATSPEAMAARRDALHRARRASRKRWVGPGRYLTAAGCVAVLASLTITLASGALSPALAYRTTLGERRVVTLEDGSHLSLDANTEVRVRYSRRARRLELLRGQARFDVAHDVTRPFTVRAGDETVVATGTAFNIDKVGAKVTVTVIQGRVTIVKNAPAPTWFAIATSVGPAPRPAPVAVLRPGQELVTGAITPLRVQSVSIDRVTAWETGQLVFEDEPLGEVAARISRYTPTPVRVEADAAQIRISGVFTSGDAATFIDTVTHYLPVEASEASDGAVTLKRRR